MISAVAAFGHVVASNPVWIEKSMSKVRIKKWMWWTLAGWVALQLYFVREMLAAELLFGLFFAALLVFGAVSYLVGVAGERFFAWAEKRARFLAPVTRRAFRALEAIAGTVLSLAGQLGRRGFEWAKSFTPRMGPSGADSNP
jgi:hypothetical protein